MKDEGTGGTDASGASSQVLLDGNLGSTSFRLVPLSPKPQGPVYLLSNLKPINLILKDSFFGRKNCTVLVGERLNKAS